MFMKSSTPLKTIVGNDGSASFLEGLCSCGGGGGGRAFGVDFEGVYFGGVCFLRGLDDGGVVVVVLTVVCGLSSILTDEMCNKGIFGDEGVIREVESLGFWGSRERKEEEKASIVFVVVVL